jgi:hypothetical protein
VTYDHRSQYDPGSSLVTRREGCVWTTGANGIAATTGGAKHPSPDAIHDLLPRNQETSPTTPGWSLTDLAKAMGRYGMTFVDYTGDGWAAVEKAHAADHYIALQGDSDQFGNSTCSGAFDGDAHDRDPPEDEGRGRRRVVVDRRPDLPDGPLGEGQRPQALRHEALGEHPVRRVPPARSRGAARRRRARGDEGRRLFTVEHTAKYPNGVITAVQIRHDTSAIRKPCSAPRKYPWPGHLGRVLVKLEDGPYIQAKFAHEAGS